MLNQVILVGRLVSDPEIREVEGKQVSYITLAVQRSYKNSEGNYDVDFIDCSLWNSIAQNTTEYCKKGDLLGIKGRLETIKVDDGDGHLTKKRMILVAEKVTFLSSRHSEDNA